MNNPYCFSLAITLLCALATTSLAQQNPRMTPSGVGYLEHLPPDYATNTSRQYPLLIFLHGMGEVGNGTPSDLNKVKVNGPPKLIEQGHNMCFTVNGVQECFIVISPQLRTGVTGWWPSILQGFFDYVMNGDQNYRVDRNRVYLTGLSMGGQGVYIGAGETTDIFAAAAVVAGYNNGNGCTISSRQIAMWGFHGMNDGTIPYSTGLAEFNRISTCTNPAPIAELKWTSYADVGHNAWDRAYTTDHSFQNPNVYEWLLSKSKGSVNAAPRVNAGTDLAVNLPVSSVTVTGSATDSDGTIANILWTKVSGPAVTMGSSNSPNLVLTDLVDGTYTFRLTATDNQGATAFDEVRVTAQTPNIAPIVSAGPDQTITLPQTTLVVSGSASDTDGGISSVSWTQQAGPSATLNRANTDALDLSNLQAGSYTFRLTATDDRGLSTFDEMILTVLPEINLALGRPVVASSVENASRLASYAVDGGSLTRWSSRFADPQWIYVDLGSEFMVNRVKLTWEKAMAADYQVQISNNATTWTTVRSVTGNTSAVSEFTGLAHQGRYVRIHGTRRTTAYGYSLFEIEIYGTPGVVQPNLPPVANAGDDIEVELPTSEVLLSGQGSDPDGDISSFSWRQLSGPPASLANAEEPETSVSDLNEGAYVFQLTVRDNGQLEASDEVAVVVTKPVITNLALNTPVVASSTEYASLAASNVVDGNIKTRWGSRFADPQWIYTDLGSVSFIDRVVIFWERALAADFQVQTSDDAIVWSTVRTITNNTNTRTEFANLNASARFVRIYGTRRATAYGYSMFELEVYGYSPGGRRRSESQPDLSFQSVPGEAISLHPMPFLDQLSVGGVLPDAAFVIRDISGAAVLQGNMQNGIIDTRSLANGMYVIDVATDYGSVRRKVMK